MRRRHLSATASPLLARRRLAVTLELPEAGRVRAPRAAAPSRGFPLGSGLGRAGGLRGWVRERVLRLGRGCRWSPHSRRTAFSYSRGWAHSLILRRTSFRVGKGAARFQTLPLSADGTFWARNLTVDPALEGFFLSFPTLPL